MKHKNPLKPEELDVVGKTFGIKINTREKGQSDLIELYTEDDGYFYYREQFAAFWLDDLISVCNKAKMQADTEVIFKF